MPTGAQLQWCERFKSKELPARQALSRARLMLERYRLRLFVSIDRVPVGKTKTTSRATAAQYHAETLLGPERVGSKD
jgi:hypothetical protein